MVSLFTYQSYKSKYIHINMNDQNNNLLAALPRRSRRLATIIPASHWISMGYSEEDARLMEKLQSDIKTYCDGELSSDEAEVILRGRNIDMLPHHDMMLPHWKKLFKTLNNRTSEYIKLSISGIHLPVSVLDIVFTTLQQPVILKKLVLCGVGLGIDGSMMLSSFIKNNAIEYLCIGSDPIEDLSVATALSDALNNHPTLQLVAFARVGLSNNTNILEIILEGCQTIKTVTICFEKFESDSIDILAGFIHSDHPVQTLKLKQVNLSDSDTLTLACALKKNTKLKELDLIRNYGITDEGEKALLNAMYDPTNMGSIVDSNHTCVAYTYDIINRSVLSRRPPLEIEVLGINIDDDMSIQRKIREKVLLALCGYGPNMELFDLSHFNDLPLQLMPRVLELIQKHFDARTRRSNEMQLEKDALSRLFHTLRGWELPLLFENLNTPAPDDNVASGKRKRRKTRRY